MLRTILLALGLGIIGTVVGCCHVAGRCDCDGPGGCNCGGGLHGEALQSEPPQYGEPVSAAVHVEPVPEGPQYLESGMEQK